MRSEHSHISQVSPAVFAQGLASLLRPINGIVAFFGISAACFIAGAEWTEWDRILLAALSGTLLGAAGNVINDVFDISIDRINKPGRAIAAGVVSPAAARIWTAVLAVIGILLSIPLGIAALAIAISSAILMYLYSAWLKRIPFVGNVVVGVLTGAAFVFGAFAFDNPAAGIVPALFAFFFNLARELLKDVEDMKGDSVNGIRTLPLVMGEAASLIIVSALLILVIFGSILPYTFTLYDEVYFWVVFIGVDCVLAYVLFALWNDRSTGNIARLNILLKYDMLLGIAAIVLGAR